MGRSNAIKKKELNPGEERFLRWCVAQGAYTLQFDNDLGYPVFGAKEPRPGEPIHRPDFLVCSDGHSVAIDVKYYTVEMQNYDIGEVSFPAAYEPGCLLQISSSYILPKDIRELWQFESMSGIPTYIFIIPNEKSHPQAKRNLASVFRISELQSCFGFADRQSELLRYAAKAIFGVDSDLKQETRRVNHKSNEFVTDSRFFNLVEFEVCSGKMSSSQDHSTSDAELNDLRSVEAEYLTLPVSSSNIIRGELGYRVPLHMFSPYSGRAKYPYRFPAPIDLEKTSTLKDIFRLTDPSLRGIIPPNAGLLRKLGKVEESGVYIPANVRIDYLSCERFILENDKG